MTPSERSVLLESYGQAPELLARELPQFPRARWQFRPAPDRWTIHEILVHITDSEANSYVRCRRALAEPGQSVMAYDEWGWAQSLQYHAQDPDAAVALFGALRRSTYALVRGLPEAAWARTLQHPENGVMTLDDWLRVYERHVPDHLAQMRAVLAEAPA